MEASSRDDSDAPPPRRDANNNKTTKCEPVHKSSDNQRIPIVLLLENSRKNNNWGPTLRCASAFGIQTVVFVGYAQCAVQGSHGADKHVEIVAFPTVPQAVDFLRNEYCNHQSADCTPPSTARVAASLPPCTSTKIIGLIGAVPGGYADYGCALRLYDGEDTYKSWSPGLVQALVVEDQDDNAVASSSSTRTSDSTPSSSWTSCGWSSHRSYPVSRTKRMLSYSASKEDESPISLPDLVVVAISKDWHGLSVNLAQHCDSFCHVPHVAIPSNDPGRRRQAASKPLLDLPTTLSIALHHITAHLGYREGEFQGHKFHVSKTRHTNNEDIQRQRRERRARERQCQEQEVSEVMDNHGTDLCLFQEEQNGDY